ncbi:MAG: glycosyltransferase family 2 protein [Candidatus Eremiobacteraeota bacterium]|nr:glycosyltransferase family 2 protein [Candidatus Eremiobacteraeota bacterium]
MRARPAATSRANAARNRAGNLGVHGADITFVIITKNEAANIAACLHSLPEKSVALVYDAFSDDATVEIARSLGATVIQARWAGFARAREDAAALVKTGWTFMLDADERVTKELTQEIAALEPAINVSAYSLARRNHFCGRWIRSAGWWPDRLVRLFRTGQATMIARGSSSHAVHETWQPHGGCVALRFPIDHFSYASVAEYRRKFALYSALEARGARVGLARVVAAWAAVPLRAAWFLVRRGGVFEGWRGAYVCTGSALYPAVVATKRWASRHEHATR